MLLCSWLDTKQLQILRTFKWDTMHSYSLRGCEIARGQSWSSEKISFFRRKEDICSNNQHSCLFFFVASVCPLSGCWLSHFIVTFLHSSRCLIRPLLQLGFLVFSTLETGSNFFPSFQFDLPQFWSSLSGNPLELPASWMYSTSSKSPYNFEWYGV